MLYFKLFNFKAFLNSYYYIIVINTCYYASLMYVNYLYIVIRNFVTAFSPASHMSLRWNCSIHFSMRFAVAAYISALLPPTRKM